MTADLFVGEARLLRARLAALEDRLLRRLDGRSGATHRVVGRVYSQGAIPTTAGKFYACHPVIVTGAEVEGGTPVLTEDTTRSFLVALLGGTATAGDDLVCRRVDHRWVATKGAAPPTVDGNLCVQLTGCSASTNAPGLLDGSSIRVTGPGGFDQTATTTGAVNTITVVNAGGGYATPIALNVGGPGSGFVGSVVSRGTMSALNLTNGGGGFTRAPTVNIAGSTGAAGAATLVATTVDFATIVNKGTGYTLAGITFGGGGGGAGAAGTVILGGGIDPTIAVVNGGTGYTTANVTFNGGAGTGATGTVNLGGGSVVGVTMNTAGSGYTPPLRVTITGDGTGATATATIDLSTVEGVIITNPGANYTSTVTGTITGNGSGATCTVSLHGVAIDHLTVTNGGVNTRSDALVSFTNTGGGTGATATLDLTGATILFIGITNGGHDFATVPAVSVSASSGSGAVLKAIAGSTACFTLTATGTYTIAVTPPGGSRFVARTVTAGVAGLSATRNLQTVQLTPATGYVCTNLCDQPLAQTLHCSTPQGTIAMVWAGTGTTIWNGQGLLKPLGEVLAGGSNPCFTQASGDILVNVSLKTAAPALGTVGGYAICCTNFGSGYAGYFGITSQTLPTTSVSPPVSSTAITVVSCNPPVFTFTAPATVSSPAPGSIDLARCEALSPVAIVTRDNPMAGTLTITE